MKKLIIAIFAVFYLSAFPADKLDSLYHHFTFGNGISLGPENGITFIPTKVSLYYYLAEKNYEKYVGAEFGAWLIAFPCFSVDILAGVKKNEYTFDTSLSYLVVPEQDIPEYGYSPIKSYFAINPKLGIKTGWFWFKSGPSFTFFKRNDPSIAELNKIGKLFFNFELSLQIPIKIPDYRKIAAYNNRPK